MNFMNSTIFTRDIFVFGFPYIIFAKQKQKADLWDPLSSTSTPP